MLNRYVYNFSFSNVVIFISLISHIVIPYTNIGFYAMDEHFQILEPLAYKLDLRENVNIDIWEFGATMRPWAQIYLYLLIINFLKIFFINNPFLWIFFIQLFLSILGFLSILYLYKLLLDKNIIVETKFNLLIYFLFVFNLFLHARTSSENLSITLFIFGIYFILRKDNFYILNYKDLLISSLFFGLSLITRYQIIFLIAPFYLWYLIYYKTIYQIFVSSIVIVFVLVLGLVIDYFGYGFINNTYYNYFYYNIIVGIFDNFGIEPWWYYIKELSLRFYPPIGFFILLGFIIFFIVNFRSFITWISSIYFITFSYLGHKELRFIFPILVLSPIFLIYINSHLHKLNFLRIRKIFMNLILSFNFIFFITLFLPAERQTHLYRYIYNNIFSDTIYYTDRNPYLIDGLIPTFYISSLPKIKKIDLNENFKNVNLVINEYKIYIKILDNHSNCYKLYSSYPEKIIELNQNWKNKNLNWFILKCT